MTEKMSKEMGEEDAYVERSRKGKLERSRTNGKLEK